MIKPIRATGLERLELQRLRDRVGRLYAALQEATEAENPLASNAWAPPVDLCETEKMILIRAELPGVTADQIKIGLSNSKLRIWGEKIFRISVLNEVLVRLAAWCPCVGRFAFAAHPRNWKTECYIFIFQRSKTAGERRFERRFW
jgi:hypothetical protein